MCKHSSKTMCNCSVEHTSTLYTSRCGGIYKDDVLIANCYHTDLNVATANAKFIVRACNSHEELLEVSKQLKENMHTIQNALRKQPYTIHNEHFRKWLWGLSADCEDAIAKAGGK